MNVVLTGLPRSGTTLAVSLLNRLDDVVALHEPIDFSVRPLSGPSPWQSAVEPYFAEARRSILSEKRIETRVFEGGEDNPFGAARDAAGLRTSKTWIAPVAITKPLTPDFTLVVKHPMAFTAVVDKLVPHVPVFAIIRNPLALLASWASVDGNFNRGRIPVAESLNDEIRTRLAACGDVLARQLVIIDWMFSQYARYLRPTSLIRYEDVVKSRGRALAVISDNAARLDAPLEERNANHLYDPATMLRCAEALLKHDGAQWQYYTRAAVEELASQIRGSGA